MSVPDYQLKSDVLVLDGFNDILKINRQVSLTFYLAQRGYDDDRLPMSLASANAFVSYFESLYPVEWNEATKINHAFYERTKRLRCKMHFLLSRSDCTFLTLTFNNEFLNTTSATYRRKYVSRFLNSLDCSYIANIDFGKQNAREHYHAVVACVPTVDQMKAYSCGFYSVQPVRDTSDDEVRLAKYVSKLSNHAIKETTKRSALLYSRKYPIPSALPKDRLVPIHELDFDYDSLSWLLD